MKIFTIVIHVLPTELLNLRRILKDLEESVNIVYDNIDAQDVVINIFVTLNISDTIMTFIDKSIFISYYNSIFNEFSTKLKLHFNTSDDLNIAGTTAQKRSVINNDLDSDIFIFLDPDIYFPSVLLYYMISSVKLVCNDTDMFVITPNTMRLWDNTWDCLTHRNYISNDFKSYKTTDPLIANRQEITDINLKEIPTFKFGCGWFTLYSRNFVQFIGIPDSFGDYASEDTYMMECAKLLQTNGYNIKQYVIDGLFIVEDYIHRPEFNAQLVRYNLNKTGLKTHNSPVFIEEIHNFINNKL